jgi:serralysin
MTMEPFAIKKTSFKSTAKLISALGLLLVGCEGGTIEPAEAPPVTQQTFEQFEASLPREARGAYVVEGDIPVWTKEELRRYWDDQQGQALARTSADGIETVKQPLAVRTVSGVDTKWGPGQQTNLTYCVSTGFGGNYSTVVSAMQNAAASWQAAANVRFVYSSGQDGNCNAGNNSVVFDVRPGDLGPNYSALSFFPDYARSSRSLIIDPKAFPALTDHLRHELGHILGFRHEHTAGSTTVNGTYACYEDSNWRALTAYDTGSIMHYNACGGTRSGFLTSQDQNGVACLYGAAPGFTPNCTYRGITYQAQVASVGWLPLVKSGNIAGTVGQSRRVEAMDIFMQSTPGVGVCYSAYVQGKAWMTEVCNGAQAGTIGLSLRMEAVKVRLINAPAGCNVVYQAHVSGLGWQAPVSNNQVAGTTGQSRAIEALKISTTGSCGF